MGPSIKFVLTIIDVFPNQKNGGNFYCGKKGQTTNPLSRHIKSVKFPSDIYLYWNHLFIETVRTELKLSGQNWNCPVRIEAVRTELQPSGQNWNRPVRIEAVRTELKLSAQNWNRSDRIETLWTEFKPSGRYWNRPDSIETFLTELKLSGQN